MPSLSKELRSLLERSIAGENGARQIAESGADQSLRRLAVDRHEAHASLSPAERTLRINLRAHGRQLGDKRDLQRGSQSIDHLKQAVAYEHWHRLLFARFLAENQLLMHPIHDVPVSLDEVKELALGQGRDWIEVAADYAQRMLLHAVFRSDDPALQVPLSPEKRLQLEKKLSSLPREIFLADDSLGWVYQFWQKDAKEQVNRSEVKIGADELSPVTQLFTEDYMVLFLLENTLGAWWTARKTKPDLYGYRWTYLRLNGDGTPAAGSFEGWPRSVKELRVLDPCMGSGHFLTFALPILSFMRSEEESIPLREAIYAVLRDNLFGLELDLRCSQIAAFSLALTAWKLNASHFELPQLNLACCGVSPNTSKDQWITVGAEIASRSGMPAKVNLFGSDESLLSEPVRRTMEALHQLFSQAPVLGSLIDPGNMPAPLLQADYKTAAQLMSTILEGQYDADESLESVIAASGMIKAAVLLSMKYSLIVTNVPYLGRGRQNSTLRDYCEDFHSDAAADLAACFLDRCLSFSGDGCTLAIVTKQEPLFLKQYKAQRLRLVKSTQWNLVARLGPRAFEMISGERVNVCLIGITNRHPEASDSFLGMDAGKLSSPPEKAAFLASGMYRLVNQQEQLKNPDIRIVLEETGSSALLSNFASALAGHADGDSCRFERSFWEVPKIGVQWEFLQSTVAKTMPFGGRSGIIFWENESGEMYDLAMRVRHLNHIAQNWLRGKPNWGKRGVVISQIGNLPATLYHGQIYDCNCCAIVPHNEDDVAAIWAYCSSKEFARDVRKLDQKMNVAPHTLLKVPFDKVRWSIVAQEQFPDGLPEPESDSLDQWIFSGRPLDSPSTIQVAVARLVGYQWPRQTGSPFAGCPPVGPDGLEAFGASDGIVPLSSVAGVASGADRLRSILAAAYGDDWSAARLAELYPEKESLEVWLRDHFFGEHCRLFYQCPFIWHVWDGRKDGFHALVNYHRLDRRTMEKLIYSYLGDWLTRQRQDVHAGVEGADTRLAAAEHLQKELIKILTGEKPYDVFVRWKPLQQQPIGWEPDLNDGVRMNIRPWITEATLYRATKPGILRITPNFKYTKDRGKEPKRDSKEFPWFSDSTDRINDLHLSLTEKLNARGLK